MGLPSDLGTWNFLALKVVILLKNRKYPALFPFDSPTDHLSVYSPSTRFKFKEAIFTWTLPCDTVQSSRILIQFNSIQFLISFHIGHYKFTVFM